MSIVAKLSKNEKFRYFVRFFKNINKRAVVHDMNCLYDNPDSFFVDHCGDENMGKLILPLIADRKDDGFWALMRRVLAGLVYAEDNGMTPVAEFTLDVPYAQEPGFLGTNDPFEYYFMPLLPGDWRKSRAIVRTKGVSKGYSGDRLFVAYEKIEAKYGGEYGLSEEYTERLADMWKKYIFFNDRTEKQVKDTPIIKKILEKKTLGVHVRGTDYNRGVSGHPVAVSESEHILRAKKLLQDKGYEQVFLATDEQKTADAFRDEFGDSLIIYDDILRSTDGNPVHLTEKERPEHHYLLGIEILKDSYALSECAGLVCGISQVSNGVRIMKKACGEKYEDVEIIDRGLNL